MSSSQLSGLKPVELPKESKSGLGAPPIAITPRSKDDGERRWADFLERTEARDLKAIADKLAADKPAREFLTAAFDLSPYLADLARQHPQVIEVCHEQGFEAALESCLAPVEAGEVHHLPEAELGILLRTAKRQASLVSGLADLGGWWSWETVSRAISRTADISVRATIRHLLYAAHQQEKLVLPDPENPDEGSGYFVLAMGKHGAGELNFSSDIDLIVIFDPYVDAIIDPDESVKMFVRMTKSLVRIMQERTAEGYVFRTDLRLRPAPTTSWQKPNLKGRRSLSFRASDT